MVPAQVYRRSRFAEDRYFAERNASSRLADRYGLRLAIREHGLEGTNPISPVSPPGSIELLPPHDAIPPASELFMIEEPTRPHAQTTGLCHSFTRPSSHTPVAVSPTVFQCLNFAATRMRSGEQP